MTMDWDQERDWVLNNPLEAHDIICTQRKEIERLQTTVNAQAGTLRIANVQRLTALADAIPGDDKLATVQWAVKIATQHLISTDRTRYVTAERLNALDALMDATDACPPSVRAALRGEVQPPELHGSHPRRTTPVLWAGAVMSERVEYGRQLDCAKNGCTPPHSDDGYVSEWDERHFGPPDLTRAFVINNHATTWVKRTVTTTDWEPA